MRTGLKYPAEDLIKPHDVSVGKFALIFKLRRIRIGHMPVHIPFDIAYLRAVKHGADRAHDVVPHLPARQVKKKLISAEARPSHGRLYRPVGVLPIEL